MRQYKCAVRLEWDFLIYTFINIKFLIMNKKFSTLLAGVALMGAFSANAGTPVKTVKADGLYQLAAGAFTTATTGASEVLSMDQDGKLHFVKNSEIAAAADTLGYTLWCVEVTAEGLGKAPVYNFVNKATGQRLDFPYVGTALSTVAAGDVAATTALPVGGEMCDWAFSATYEKVMNPATMYAYFSKDSVVGLKKSGADDVVLYKTSATKAQADAQVGTNMQIFTLVEPDSVVLNAKALNTIFGTQKADKGVKLTFTPDKNNTTLKNFFTDDAKFFAVDVDDAVSTTPTTAVPDAPWLRIMKGPKADSTFVYVDTAYVNESGTKFLGFNTKQLTSAKLNAAGTTKNTVADTLGTALNDQSKFRFVYYPAQDSMVIQVKQATFKAAGKKYFNDTPDQIKLDNNGEVTFASPALAADTDIHNKANYVTVQDLVKADQIRIATIYFKKEVMIKLGYAGCGLAAQTKTTVADDLYVIRNAKTGKYLAVPVYNNAQYLDNVANPNQYEEVTLELQDAQHMPAYQWVVLKNNLVDKNNVSLISITNREYTLVGASNVQLHKNAGAKYFYTTAGSAFAGDSLEFIPVEKQYKEDARLGYKFLEKNDLLTQKYSFNYYHPYASDKYIATEVIGKDTLMTVLNGVTAFSIKAGADKTYGYTVDATIGGSQTVKGRIHGLAQLKRQAYQIVDGKGVFGQFDEAVENRYNVSAKNDAAEDFFFFKENNCIKRGEDATASHYYAIVEVDATTGAIQAYKAGVSDFDAKAGLRAQNLYETRTSVFYIAPYEIPLYRRFNNTNLGESATDATDTLKFVESIRGEYLMDEWNEKLQDKTVDYAGIWTADKANGKLAFVVDTAWLNRGAGKVKPQYLISVDQHIINQDVVIKPCEEGTPHIKPDGTPTDDPSECVHAKREYRNYAVAKYLVSFSDSAKLHADKPYMDIKNGYTRVGFVKGMRFGDTLVILTNGFEKVEAAKLDTAAIFKYYKANGLTNRVIDLKGDAHKNVTWSFRYVTPSVEARTTAEEGAVNSFLFESNIYEATGAAVNPGLNTTLSNGTTPMAGSIAPSVAAWLKMQNGCLVLTRGDSKFGDAKTGADGALIFNAYPNVEGDDLVTDNEEVAVEGVQVVAGNGVVTVQGAAGETVTVSNILGQTLAQQVLTSDNATIAVPAGVVVVKVANEAVKVVVK